MSWYKRALLHPFLMAVYPILALLANNPSEIRPWDAVRSILLALVMAVIFLTGLWFALRDWLKAALLTTFLLLLFFSYGHIYGIIEDAQLAAVNLGRHRFLMGIWLLFFVITTWWITRRKMNLERANQAMNLIALTLIFFPAVQALRLTINQKEASRDIQVREAANTELEAQLSGLRIPVSTAQPDIYYIVLDAYTRDDTLRTYFKYDNEPFIRDLEQLGFYVARCSQSNYSKTQLSLASSLNMNYINAFGLDENSVASETELNYLLLNNIVRRTLKNLGYRDVVIESGFSPTEWTDSDIYLAANKDARKMPNLIGGINPFEALLLRTSAGLLLFEIKPRLPYQVQSFLDSAYIQHRDRILYSITQLEAIPSIPGHKFVFVHLLAPHEPFVFGPNGEIVGRRTPFSLNNDEDTYDIKTYRRGYRNQVNYLNSRIIPLLKKILETSPSPPIIILQGDHGSLQRASSQNARMTILNAYYLPGNGRQRLYAQITPVNTFRLIFDAYFGSNLGLLEDRSFFYDDEQNVFLASPNQREGCQEDR